MSDLPPGVAETTYKDHRFAFRDDDEGFELWIDGRSWGHMVGRLGPQRYATHLLPFVEFDSPEAMAHAVIDRVGEAWIEQGEGGHDHGPHDPPGHEPHG